MKTIDLEEIANKEFEKNGLKSKDYAIIYTDTRSMYDVMLLVAAEYGKQLSEQCCCEQIKACAEGIDNGDAGYLDMVLSTPNVVTTKA